MSRVFAYCRVSTVEQTTKNQIQAIKDRGHKVHYSRVVEDIVSGSVPAMQRENFKTLVQHKLEKDDTLVVLKLDRLGRDNIDVQQTITMLGDMGVKVICLDLPVADLSSSEGKLMLQMFSAFAEFERNRIRERTSEGLNRAKAEGKELGRPKKATPEQVKKLRAEGLSIAKTAKQLGISPATVNRLQKIEA